jgi:hypothetical protein
MDTPPNLEQQRALEALHVNNKAFMTAHAEHDF